MKKIEYVFYELGYFDKEQIERLKEALEGKTLMKFEIACSGSGPNCTLVIRTTYNTSKSYLRNLFLYCALNRI